MMSENYVTFVLVACVLCWVSVGVVVSGFPLLASVPLYLSLAALVVAVWMSPLGPKSHRSLEAVLGTLVGASGDSL